LAGGPKERAKGHVNWEPATYEGTISFGSSSDDFDWTWNFKPINQEGLTQQNHGSVTGKPEYIHAEFDATETVRGFMTKTWSEIREGFDCFEDEPGCKQKNIAARKLVAGKRAIVTGLVGLDTEHGGYSELHPVYAMAIEVDPDPSNDTWILFIRNRGNEGFCSRHDHPLPNLKKFALLLPKPANSQANGATFANDTSFSSTIENNCPALRFDSAQQGVVVEFDLLQQPVGKPYRGPMLEGEIHIQWQLQTPITPVKPEAFPIGPSADEDEHFLTPDQRRQYRSNMMAQEQQLFGSSQGFHACSPVFIAALPLEKPIKTKSPDHKQIEREINDYYEAMVLELCKANPSLGGCDQVRKKAKK